MIMKTLTYLQACKLAKQKLLECVNSYELKQRKVLRGVRFTQTSAHWSGHHNYSVALYPTSND